MFYSPRARQFISKLSFVGSLNFGKTNSAFFFLSLHIFTTQKFSTDIIYKNQTIIVWYQNITSKFHYIPFH